MRTAFAATKVALFGIVIMQGACATIVHGTTQTVPITSSPTGAKVSIDSVAAGRTPYYALLSRGRHHSVSVALDTGAAFNVELAKKISPWLYGNLFTYMLPALLDFSNGAAYDVSPNAVHVAFPGFGEVAGGATPSLSVAGGERIRMLTTTSPGSFVYATVDETGANQLVVRMSANSTAPPSNISEAVQTSDIRRIDYSTATERAVNGQLFMRLGAQLGLAAGALYTQSTVGTLFVGALFNICAIPASYFIGYSLSVPRWSPREAHRIGSPLLAGDRLRVRLNDSPHRRISGRLVDMDGADMLIAVSKDTIRVLRTSISSVERAGGINFKKATLIAIGVGATIGVTEVATRNFAQSQSEWIVVPVAGALLALGSLPAFAPRRWVKVLKW